MKKKGRILVAAMLAGCMSFATFGLAACEEDSTDSTSAGSNSSATQQQDHTAVGEYYCDVNGQEYALSIKDDDTVSLTMGSVTHSGTYTYDGSSMQFAFTDGTQVSVSVSQGAVTVSTGGTSYTFILKKNLTVKYMDGETLLSEKTVLNGKTTEKITAPEKDGYRFIGWYTSASYDKVYSFDAPVTEDITIHALYVAFDADAAEFEVALDAAYDGAEALLAQRTIGGKLYNLPTPTREGYTFVGWWISDYEDAEKLTARYVEGTAITENRTLYAVWDDNGGAPIVSVKETGVTWTASGVNNSYSVVIKDAEGNQIGGRNGLSVSTYNYDFASQAAGDYTVSVTCRGKTTTVYYKNKALSRVSIFSVTDSVLLFNGVENAEKYYITVDCGSESHTHTFYDLGESLSFDFSACDMQEGGITFVVTAEADGYVTSTSETYVYERHLDAITGLAVNGEVVSWNAVENATGYVLNINGQDIDVGNETSYDLRFYAAGNMAIKVYPVAKGFNSSVAAETTWEKTTLAAPVNLSISGATVTWDAVEGALSYKIKIGNSVYTSATNSFVYDDADEAMDEVAVSVQAVAATEAANSGYSNVLTVKYGEMADSIVYDQGVFTWNPVFGCNEYMVKLNDGEAVKITGNSYVATFNKAGENTISVCTVKADGSYGKWVSASVNAKAITFDAQEGEEVATIYKVTGDPISLPETTRDGYDFVGWFDAKEGGEKYTDGKFLATTDVTLYALWIGSEYKVKLNPGKDSEDSFSDLTVRFKEGYDLPVPTTKDTTKAFIGWFTDPNCMGIQCTDHTGKSSTGWLFYGDKELYAGWSDVFAFELDGMKTSYLCTKGNAINYVTEVTVPATYNGKPVSTVESFTSLPNLVTINIPNTVTNIEETAFSGSSNLKNVNIYDPAVEGLLSSGKYESEDGVLIYNNVYGGKEIKYFPVGRTGIYYVPSGIQTIADSVFQSASITEIYIPASVTAIATNAFLSSKLEKIEFLPTEDDTVGETLVLEKDAFKNCTYLVEIVLPSRLGKVESFADVFTGCSKLANISIAGNGGNYTAKSGVLCVKTTDSDINNLEIVFCPAGKEGVFEIPNGVTSVGDNAFAKCTKIEELVVPGWVTNIGEYAFNSCSMLSKVTFNGESGDAFLTIKANAFYSCSKLTEVSLPANLYTLGESAFYCTNLTSVYVYCEGDKDGKLNFAVNSFASSAGVGYVTYLYLGEKVPAMTISGIFSSRSGKLSTVEVHPDNPNYTSRDSVLYNKDVTEILYFPIEKGGEYVIPDTVTKIGANLFAYNKVLTSVTIPASVKEIGQYAFYYCSGLTELNFEDGAEKLSIEQYAFYYCSALTSLNLPTRLEKIGERVFYYCSALKELTVPEGVKTIEDYAFYNCSSLKTINLPSTLQYFGGYTKASEGEEAVWSSFHLFEGCTELSTITVNENSEYFTVVDGVLYALEKTYVKNGENYEEQAVARTLVFCPRNYAGVVRVPDTVIKIWAQAFYQNGYSVTLGGVTEIAFSQNPLKTYSYDAETDTYTENETKIEIGAKAFYYCNKLEKITLPVGLTNISDNMFQDCISLETISIPDTVIEIGLRAFENCSSLEEITIPKSVESLGYGAFNKCTSLTRVTFEEGGTADLVLEASTSSTYGTFKGTLVTEIVLPERTKSIGAYAFYSCTQLASVSLPASLEEIGDNAFYYCYAPTVTIAEGSKLATIGYRAFYYAKMTSFVVPASVSEIGEEAFSNCYKMTTVKFEENAKLKELENKAFTGCSILESVNLEACTALEKIDYYAFYSNKALKSITIPATVKSLGAASSGSSVGMVFYNCTALETVNFALNEEGLSALEEIKTKCFQNTALTSFSFPASSSTLTLGEALFTGCTTLTTLNLSKSVTSIVGLLTGCESVKKITISEENENFSADETLPIIYNKDGTAIRMIYSELPKGYVISDKVIEIEAKVFQGQDTLIEIEIPKTIQKIGDYAFADCTKLTSVTFASGSVLQTLGTYVFSGCTSLSSIALPADITSIGNYCFTKSGIVSADLSNLSATVTLGDHMFDSCLRLSEVKLSENLKSLGNYMFKGCTALESIDLPSGLTFLGTYTFQNSGLKSIVIPESVIYIGKTANKAAAIADATYVFDGCASLAEVTLPASLQTIGAYTFRNCTALESLVIPESVTLLGNYCFQKTALTAITFNAGVKSIGNYCFSGTEIESADLSALTASVTLGTNIFADCKSLKDVNLGENLAILGNYMFNGCTALETIDLPSTLTFLGTYTFRNSGLKSIVIPDSVMHLGKTANKAAAAADAVYLFDGCTRLTSVTLPANLQTMGAYVFNNCSSLSEINIPAGVSVIGNYCFAGTAITSVDLSANGNVTLGTYLFSGCTQLESVKLNGAMTALGDYMFKGCTSLTEIELPSALTYMGIYTFQNSGLKKIVVPDSVVNFGAKKGAAATITASAGVFDGCADLTDVTLPANLKTIGGYTFRNCTSLADVKLPATVTIIGASCFAGTAITSVDLSEYNISFGTYVFSGCEQLSSVKLNDSMTVLPNGMFKGCVALETIDLPSGLTYLGTYTFQNSGLKSIVIPDTVEHIGTTANKAATATNSVYLFDGCASLTDVTLPANLKTIGGYVFRNCSALTSLNLPKTVTVLGNYCLSGTGLTSVDLSDYEITYGTYIFSGCTELKEVKLNDSLTSLGNYMFKDCTALESITLPSALTYMGTSTFQNSGLKSIVIPDTVVHIGTTANKAATTSNSVYLFDGCASLTDVTLPANLQTIGAYAFRNCTALTEIEIPSSVTLMGNYCFQGSGLIGVTLSEGLKTMGNYCFESTALESVTLPSTLTATGNNSFRYAALKSVDLSKLSNKTTMGTNLFDGCENLTTVNFGENLTTLGNYSFRNCSSLTSVTLPASITSVGNYCFYGTPIVSADLSALGESVTFGTYVFSDCTKLTSVKLSDSLKSLGNYMFDGCTMLTDISLPSSLTFMGTYTFRDSGLERITIPSGVKYLGSAAETCTVATGVYLFDGCENLTTVILPDSLEGIGVGVFRNCKALTSISIPDSVSIIGYYAFQYSGLDAVELPDSLAVLGGQAFEGTTIRKVHIPAALQTYYVAALGGCELLEEITVDSGSDTFFVSEAGSLHFKNGNGLVCYPAGRTPENGEITVPNGVSIDQYAFYGCQNVEKIILSEGITEIKQHAFHGCLGLKEVILPSTLTTIGMYAFVYSGIEKIVIPETVTFVDIGAFAFSGLKELEIQGNTTFADATHYISVAVSSTSKHGVFAGCESLTKITLSDKVTTLAKRMFDSCTALENIVLPEGLTTIADSVFYSCTSLKSIDIPSSVVSIGGYCFQKSGLESIDLSKLNRNIDWASKYSIFASCENLTEIIFGDTITELGTFMFAGCTSLKSVTLPASLKSITTYAFDGCTSLSYVYIPDGVTEIGNRAFQNCTALPSVYIPASVIKVGNYAFNGWTAEQTVYLWHSEAYATANWYTSDQYGKVTWLEGCEAKVVYNYTPESTESTESTENV